MDISKIYDHTTAQEMKFIDGLGTHGEIPIDKGKVLSQYIYAAKKRVNWGGMDKNIVMHHARRCLRVLDK